MLLRDNIYRAIRRAILTCEYRPGQELREQALAEHYHVSRSPVRDSLLRLEQENLVTVLPRQGYRVNEVSMTDVEDIFGLILLVDPACAAAAAKNEVAGGILDQFRGYPDRVGGLITFIDYNRAFHGALADLSGNARLAAVAHDLAEQFDRLVRISRYDYHIVAVEHIVREHDAIISAIQAHDSDAAARLTYVHVDGGRSRIISTLQQQSGPQANHWNERSIC